VEVTPHQGGTVKINGALQSSYPAYRTFVEETVIELEAQPLAGYEFVSWSGDLSGGENPISLEMDSAKVVTAIFTNITHPLIIQVTGHGSTNPAAGTYNYAEGTEVTVIASPDSGWRFDSWSGGVPYPYLATNTIVITSDETITASFSQIMHSLTLTAQGNGHLTPEIGTHSYGEGSEVTVTAIPDSGWQFDGWSGEVSDPDSATTTVVITSDKTVTANFSQIMHSLTLTAEGNGHLTPEIGTHSYAERTEVTVTATPDSGWQFDGWSGEVSDPDSATTTVVISSDKTVTANFSKNIFNAGVIGIIAGSVGAGMAALFVTRRRKTRPKTTKQS
jgi:uncharacterized repeat protein (TIGR02543 family)